MYNYNNKPILVFYETTKACDLACKHCRASAIEARLPDEMTVDQSVNFVKSLRNFGKPYPILILTGGDMLKKEGLEEILRTAYEYKIPVSASPAATSRLNDESFELLKKYNVLSISLSLDGLRETHNWLRGYDWVFDKTMEAINTARNHKMPVQINTVVLKKNIMELPDILKLLITNNIRVWEVFFLIKTGRSIDFEDLTPLEYEDVNHWLYYITSYNMTVRTVESPIFRRIADEKETYHGTSLYRELIRKTHELLGLPDGKPHVHMEKTRDGKGIIFVSHNGDVYPSGFLPVVLGNVKRESIVHIYQNNDILRRLRNPENLEGLCGSCGYSDVCGGSRARAYATFNDIFAEDPACINTYNFIK